MPTAQEQEQGCPGYLCAGDHVEHPSAGVFAGALLLLKFSRSASYAFESLLLIRERHEHNGYSDPADSLQPCTISVWLGKRSYGSIGHFPINAIRVG